ncbi:MAG: hypothetical protein M3416_20495, partial [Acidobacteriota bacterium]|nr:hypothetical protein [Acidobacteriota bacterium]
MGAPPQALIHRHAREVGAGRAGRGCRERGRGAVASMIQLRGECGGQAHRPGGMPASVRGRCRG